VRGRLAQVGYLEAILVENVILDASQACSLATLKLHHATRIGGTARLLRSVAKLLEGGNVAALQCARVRVRSHVSSTDTSLYQTRCVFLYNCRDEDAHHGDGALKRFNQR
jgi:hypothetical protein